MKKIQKLVVVCALATVSLQAATVATVNGTSIDERDLIPVMQQITQGRYTQLKAEQKDRVKQVALDQAIAQILVQEQAKKSGIFKSKAYKSALKETLAKIEPKLASEVWLKQEFDKINVSAKDVKKFYNENKEKFQTPKQVHARHILVEKESQAKDIIKTLKGKKGLKAAFIKLAEEKSTGPSAKNGGDLGFFGAGAMVPAFDKAVFAMKKNSITTKPVKTKFGYHVIYLEDMRGGEKKSYKELKPVAEQNLKTVRFQDQLKGLMEKLKSKAKISYK